MRLGLTNGEVGKAKLLKEVQRTVINLTDYPPTPFTTLSHWSGRSTTQLGLQLEQLDPNTEQKLNP